ncbi:CxxC-x17-CxxC domain-containing protein [Candidatus Omnitrophota bacterium]
MEQKLDILINQSSKRPFEKSYSQNSSRGFNRPHRYDRGRQDNGPRERAYTRAVCADCKKECEIPFKPSQDRPVYCKECFPKYKKDNMFSPSRDNRREERDFPRERSFSKRPGEKRQKPVTKNVPFYASRKRRA